MSHLWSHKIKGLLDYCHIRLMHTIKRGDNVNSLLNYCYISLLTNRLLTHQNTETSEYCHVGLLSGYCYVRPLTHQTIKRLRPFSLSHQQISLLILKGISTSNFNTTLQLEKKSNYVLNMIIKFCSQCDPWGFYDINPTANSFTVARQSNKFFQWFH